MDCTYKAKAYRKLLCIIGGVTPLNTTFWKGEVNEDKTDKKDEDRDKGADKIGKNADWLNARTWSSCGTQLIGSFS